MRHWYETWTKMKKWGGTKSTHQEKNCVVSYRVKRTRWRLQLERNFFEIICKWSAAETIAKTRQRVSSSPCSLTKNRPQKSLCARFRRDDTFRRGDHPFANFFCKSCGYELHVTCYVITAAQLLRHCLWVLLVSCSSGYWRSRSGLCCFSHGVWHLTCIKAVI